MTVNPANYRKIRMSAGLFDATHSFGRLFARGKDAIDLLHRMSTNDVKPLETSKGQAIVTALLNEKGRMVDVLKVIRDKAGEILIVTSKDKEEAVIQWLDKFTIMEDAQFIRATETISQFGILGPKNSSILQGYFVDAMDGVDVRAAQIAEAPATIWKESDFGFWIFTLRENAEHVWKALEQDVLAAGGAIIDNDLFELLRIEAGMPKAPNEINEKHNPLELPIASETVSFTKGCYIGQEVIARLDAQDKVQRHLVGLRFEDGIPSIGDRIIDPTIPQSAPLGNEIGEVTSAAESPQSGSIGLGYVRGKYANPGARLSVQDSTGNKIPITLVQLPFNV